MGNIDILSVLRKYFSHSDFRKPQREIIESVISGKDTLAIMPTGGGKSLCYQLPAIVLKGVTVVVSPLIALMKDQVDALHARGISAAMVNSSQSWDEQKQVLDSLRSGKIKLAYVAPERFRAASFASALKGVEISLFAIDEAHCISQWGHDFRPDYMRLGEILDKLGRPPCAAFTATATPDVREDILKQLGMREPSVFISGFARPNLSFNITQYSSKAEKFARIKEMVDEFKTGIIYCSTRKSAEDVSQNLAEQGIAHILYHGGMTPKERDMAQEYFVGGKRDIAVATNAFGMGIDRADLRFVCHYELTGSVEAYYQEAGRAGRDGNAAYCEMLFMYADKRVQEFFIDGANPEADFVQKVYRVLSENAGNSYECTMGIDDISNAVADISRFENNPPRFGKKKGSVAINSMAVSSSIALLRRRGFIDRFDVPGSRTRGTKILNHDMDWRDVVFPDGALEEKRRRDESKLRDLLALAYSKECRQEWILKYFGERDTSPCGCCDNCAKKSVSKSRHCELSDDELTVVRKALSGVARLSWRRDKRLWAPRFGKDKIVKCLCGSRDAAVMSSGLDKLSTYGILKEHGKKFVGELIASMLDVELLEISGDEYPLLGLSERGVEIMLGESSSLSMDYPTEFSAIVSKQEKKISKARRESFTRATGGVSARAEGLSGAAQIRDIAGCTEDFNLDPNDIPLFDELVKERNRIRGAMGDVPVYLIFPNLVLKKFAALKPMDTDSAMKIRGVGEAKAARFFPQMLKIIGKYSD